MFVLIEINDLKSLELKRFMIIFSSFGPGYDEKNAIIIILMETFQLKRTKIISI